MRFVTVLVLLAQVVVVHNVAAQPAKAPRRDFNDDALPEGVNARLGTLRFQLPGSVRAVALSPDGTAVAIATDFNREGTRISFMDTATGKILRHFDSKEFNSDRMQFTPDGKSLVINSWSTLMVLDAATGKVTQSIEIADSRESAIALSLDGNWVALQPQKYVYHAPVGIWDTKTGKEVVSLAGARRPCRHMTVANGPGSCICPIRRCVFLQAFSPAAERSR